MRGSIGIAFFIRRKLRTDGRAPYSIDAIVGGRVDPAAFMLMSVFVGSGLSLLWVELHRRRDERLAKQRLCLHRWRWFSLHNRGEYWNRKCVKCEKQESCQFDGDDSQRGIR